MWYNADGNYFKLENIENRIMLRAYLQAENEKGEKWVEKESYRLDPNLLKMEKKDGMMKMEYDDFYIEPYNTGDAWDEFEKEADREFETGVEAKPAMFPGLICERHVFSEYTEI